MARFPFQRKGPISAAEDDERGNVSDVRAAAVSPPPCDVCPDASGDAVSRVGVATRCSESESEQESESESKRKR